MSVISRTSPVNDEFKRPALYKLRRRQLFNYLQSMGVQFTHIPPITELQNLVISRGIDISPLTGEIKPLGEPSDNGVMMAQMMEKMALLQEENNKLKAQENTKQEVKVEKNISEMGLFELRKVCKDRGIKVEKTDKKQTLLDKLNGAQDIT